MFDPVEHDAETPSLVLQFKSRREAEQAMSVGKVFGEKTLSLSWCVKKKIWIPDPLSLIIIIIIRFTPPPGSVDFETPDGASGSGAAGAGGGGSPGSSVLLSPNASGGIGGGGTGELGGGGGADGGANAGGDAEEEEDDDDYTPLDPAYLPPGLDEEGEEDKENLEVLLRLLGVADGSALI